MHLKAVGMYCTLTLFSRSFAQGCTWMQPREKGSQSNFKVVSYHSIQLLEQMGDGNTQRKTSAQILNRLYEHAENLQAEERVFFIQEVINNIKELFINGKCDTVTWDQKNFQMFQLNLDRQASELKQCIRILKSRASHASSFKKIKIYFKKMLLESKNYSTDDWEAVRAEVLTHLRRLDILASMEK
ncbi:interferon a3-like [Conger conger]|uniref:interferon a3-like n=1 Tax=Conger conger TaxID=82655 RepID=UPI002A5A388C|nr:interferon a3-like [Conger conger]